MSAKGYLNDSMPEKYFVVYFLFYIIVLTMKNHGYDWVPSLLDIS